MRRVIVLPVLFIALLAGLTAFLAANHVGALRDSRAQVEHTHQVIETAQSLFAAILNAETGQRGYMLTRDEAYLRPYRRAIADIPVQVRTLRQMVSDNPSQMNRVDQLQGALAIRLDIIGQTLELQQAGHSAEALDLIRSGRGRLQMNRIRTAVADIEAAEQALLLARQRAADASELRGFVVALALSALALAGLLWGFVSLGRANRSLGSALASREAAQAGLREADALTRALFEHIPDFLFVIDVGEDGAYRVADVNPALAGVIGAPAGSLRGREVGEIIPVPRLVERAHEMFGKALATRAPVSSRNAAWIPGLGQRALESTIAPLVGPNGGVERIVGSVRDITDREKAEEQLRRAQRMEAVGQLTGGVAHDFNNLLQVVLANLEMLQRHVTGGEAMQRLKNAIHGADRAAELTRQLLAFARRQPLEPKVVNLGRLVGDMAELMRRTLGERVEVETVIAGGLWNTTADPAQVESAVLNLAINARDAMAQGGRLTIELANAALDDAYAARFPDVTPGQYVMLAVSDTGEGMSQETLARVFEPFFTTKADGRGTGLGLSMVYGFVKQSNGHVQLYSERGQGTTVKIYLPRSRKTEDIPAVLDAVVARGHSEVVLVVEDEAGVRAAAVAMLGELGYRCLEAADAAQALAVLEAGEAVDLLFTDVVMPGPLKTRDFAGKAQALRPGLPVLFTSGYTENAIVHHGRLDEGVSLLSKPYSQEDLARKIAAALRGSRPAVLVVEDDGLVRAAAEDMIAELGFTVLTAEDAPSALKLLESERIDILFTDIGLPGMRGDALAVHARERWPDLRVVFASGYGDAADVEAVEGAQRLGKPYDQGALATALRGEQV